MNQDTPTFELDGETLTWREGLSLNEEVKKRSRQAAGFCDHPLIKNSISCLLCQVYDDKNQKVVLACETLPSPGSRYLTRHPSLVQAKKEVEELYKKGHSFSCSRCSHNQNCQLKTSFNQPLVDQSEPSKERFEPIKLNDKIVADFSQCIQCALCTDFEAGHTSSPVLIPSEPHPQVVGQFDHNYGVNLIDLCPTACFSSIGGQVSSSKEIHSYQDFCRGCDRLCEVEVLFEQREKQILPLRARTPELAAHWVCDEVNTQWQNRLKIPLTRTLKKTSEGWRPNQGLAIDGPWHILAPKNLPEEMWSLIDEWARRNKTLSLEFYDWQERSKESGLLRGRKTFEQDSQIKIAQIFESRPAQEKVQVCLIAPEWIGSEREWQEVLDKVSSFPKKAFLGPAINFELYDKMDELIATPSYDQLSWQGRNYQNEGHIKKRPYHLHDDVNDLVKKVFNL